MIDPKYEGLIVTTEDIQGFYCARGVKSFAVRHGLDMHKFCAEGLPAEVLLAVGDSMTDELVRVAARRMGIE